MGAVVGRRGCRGGRRGSRGEAECRRQIMKYPFAGSNRKTNVSSMFVGIIVSLQASRLGDYHFFRLLKKNSPISNPVCTKHRRGNYSEGDCECLSGAGHNSPRIRLTPVSANCLSASKTTPDAFEIIAPAGNSGRPTFAPPKTDRLVPRPSIYSVPIHCSRWIKTPMNSHPSEIG